MKIVRTDEMMRLRRTLFGERDFTRLADMASKDLRGLRRLYRQRSVISDGFLHKVLTSCDEVVRATRGEYAVYCANVAVNDCGRVHGR